MIVVENLSFAYDKKEVLHNISFEAKGGELLCILGPNGVGKSTLFKCMLGLLPRYEGTITLDQTNIRDMKPSERAEHVAYIPQAANPAFAYSVIDMVMMGTSVRMSGFKSPGKKEKAIALEALDKMGIEDLASRDYTKLSGGEQQMVLIARALSQGAKTLIMDEPTSSLDYGNQMKVQNRLKELTSKGYTVIQSTHNPEQTYFFADRIVCLKDGSIYSQGNPQTVMTEKMIEDLYRIKVAMVSTDNDRVRFFELKE